MCVAGEKVEVFFSRQKTTKCALGGGGLRADDLLVMKTLSATPSPIPLES